MRILGIPNISRHTIQTCCMLHLWRHLSERNDSHHLIILISNRFCTGHATERRHHRQLKITAQEDCPKLITDEKHNRHWLPI